jgi:hypothetical protein
MLLVDYTENGNDMERGGLQWFGIRLDLAVASHPAPLWGIIRAIQVAHRQIRLGLSMRFFIGERFGMV